MKGIWHPNGAFEPTQSTEHFVRENPGLILAALRRLTDAETCTIRPRSWTWADVQA